jgi:hypothetical protein
VTHFYKYDCSKLAYMQLLLMVTRRMRYEPMLPVQATMSRYFMVQFTMHSVHTEISCYSTRDRERSDNLYEQEINTFIN